MMAFVHNPCVCMMMSMGSIGSPSPWDMALAALGVAVSVLLAGLLLVVGPLAVYWALTLPLRRQERARLFLHVFESAVEQGRSIEQTIVSLAQTEPMSWIDRFGIIGRTLFGMPWDVYKFFTFRWRSRPFGRTLGLLADRLADGVPLDDALARCPGLVPAQVAETLRAGAAIGRVDRVLPACHTILSSATSRMRSALNYVAVVGTGFVFVSSAMLMAVVVFIIPRYRDMFLDMRMPMSPVFDWMFVDDGGVVLLRLTWGFGLALLLLALSYMTGPWLTRRLPFLGGLVDRLAMLLPWRRKRLERDFSTMLAILLDADVPEAQAIQMAGRSTANRVFVRRAEAVAESLEAGDPLPDALGRLGGGEFRWHLANALHQKTGFLDALRGWHALLEAKAFQQEQVGAQVVTTTFMLVTGLVVALFAIGIFGSLVGLIQGMLIW